MALGVFGNNGKRRRNGSLGSAERPRAMGAVPSNCWGVKQFESCHAEWWAVARDHCVAKAGNATPFYQANPKGSVDDCIKYVDGVLTEGNCVRYCPGGEATKPQAAATVASTIPGECWDQAGFKDCHAREYDKSKAACQRDYDLMLLGADPAALANCIVKATDSAVMKNCGCQRTGSSSIVYGNSNKNAAVLAFQVAYNKDVQNLLSGSTPYTCPLLNEDGKLGAGTAGAVKFVQGAPLPGRSTWFPKANADQALLSKLNAAIKGKTATLPKCTAILTASPSPPVGPPPAPVVVLPPDTVTPEEKKSNFGLLALGAAVVAIGGGVYAKHKGWF